MTSRCSVANRHRPLMCSRWLIGAIALGSLPLAVVASPPGDIFLNREWPLPSPANDIVLADLNGDGGLDLISCHDLGVWVSFSAGGESFYAPFPIGTGVCYRVEAADLDGDGDVDLVIDNFDGVSVLLNSGEGAMGLPTTHATGGGRGIALGDLTGDGRADIVTFDTVTETITVFLNDGSGGFGAPAVLAAGFSVSSGAIADIDGDGDRDVVAVFHLDDQLGVYLNDGSGALAPMVPVAFEDVRLIVAEDLNGDGDVDFAVSSGSNTVTVLFAGGGWTAGPPMTLPDSSGGLRAGDVDGDGDVDLVYPSIGHVRVLMNDGSGGFSVGPAWGVSTSGTVRLGDIDGDGDLDLACGGSPYSSSATVLFNAGGGVFREEFNTVTTIELFATDGEALDLDGDGDLDGMSVSDPGGLSPGSVSIVLNDGAGVFSSGGSFAIRRRPLGMAAGDLNGDGFPDAVIAHTDDPVVSVVLSTGPASFAPPVEVPLGHTSSRIAIGDVNGDTHLDIAVPSSQKVSLLINSGTGAFSPGAVIDVPERASGLALTDVNADDELDLITTSYVGDTVSVRLNAGGGVFGPPATFAAGVQPLEVLPVDVDGDSDVDLIVADQGSGAPNNIVDDGVTILLNDGSASFGASMFLDVGGRPADLAFVDVDLSGNPDLLVGSSNLIVVLSDGPLSFTEVRQYACGMATVPYGGADLFAAEDVDGDSDPDVMAFTTGAGMVLSRNRTLAPAPCPGDITGDGVTNISDFNILASHFGAGPAASLAEGDLTGDGLVNIADFNVLAGDFGCDAN